MYKRLVRNIHIWGSLVFLLSVSILSYLLVERDPVWLNDVTPYRWQEIFNSGTNDFYLTLKWIVVIYGIALINIPLTIWLFQRFPDRGWILGRGIALIIVVSIAWNLSIYRVVDFRNAVWLSIIALMILNLAVAWILIRKDWPKYLPISIKSLLTSEFVFIIIFAAMFIIRLNVPEIYVESFGVGSKPVDLAFLTSFVRSPYMPPFDSYVSGEYIDNYYYYGHIIIVWLIHVTGVEPEIAWNLAIPFFFAMFVGFGFWVGFNLLWFIGKNSKRQWIGGIASVVMFVSMAGGAKWGQFLLDGISGYNSILSLSHFSNEFEGIIVETPILTYLLGEIHPISLSVPFIVLTLCVGIGLIASQNIYKFRHSIFLLILLGLCSGSVSMISIWDAPSVIFVSIGIIIITGFRYNRFSIRYILFSIGVFVLAYYALVSPFFIQIEKGSRSIGIDFVSVASVRPFPLFLYCIVPFISLAPFIFAGYTRYFQNKLFGKEKNVILLLMLFGLMPLFLFIVLFALDSKISMLIIVIIVICSVIFHLCGLSFFRRESKVHIFVSVLLFYSLITFAMVNIVSVHESNLYGLGYPESNENSPYKLYSVPMIFMSLLGAWGFAFYWGISKWFRLSIIILSCMSIIYIGFLIENRLSIGAEKTGLGIDGLASMEHDDVYVYRSLYVDAADIYLSYNKVFGDIISKNSIGANMLKQKDSREKYGDPKHGNRLAGMYGFDKENIRNLFSYVPLDAKSEMLAIMWIRDNISPDSVIMENFGTHSLYFFDGGRVSTITGLMTVLSSEMFRMQYKNSFEGWAEIQRRTDDITSVYTTEDISIIKEVLSRYGVDYVYFGESERVHFGENANNLFQTMTDTLSLVFRDGNTYLYEVNLE